MSITYEYVGKTGGGAEVKTMAVQHGNPGSGIHDVVTVPIPEGEQYLVSMDIQPEASVSGNRPLLYFGDVLVGEYSTATLTGFARLVTGPVTIRAERKSAASSNTPAFTGTVYYVPFG